MATISVDVDLDGFDLDEILEEVESRYEYRNRKNKKEIDEWVKEYFAAGNAHINLSLLDQMKIDFLMNNLDKIKLKDLENLL